MARRGCLPEAQGFRQTSAARHRTGARKTLPRLGWRLRGQGPRQLSRTDARRVQHPPSEAAHLGNWPGMSMQASARRFEVPAASQARKRAGAPLRPSFTISRRGSVGVRHELAAKRAVGEIGGGDHDVEFARIRLDVVGEFVTDRVAIAFVLVLAIGPVEPNDSRAARARAAAMNGRAGNLADAAHLEVDTDRVARVADPNLGAAPAVAV